jgi:UDP-galactopyranose mutase
MDAATVVIGAGPSGLSAAYHLDDGPVLLVEAGSRVGGLCRSVYDGDFVFDQAGHIMFTNDPYIKEMYVKLLGDNVHWQPREAWIYTHTGDGGVYTRYPFQASFHGLPVETVKECLIGAVEAIHGDHNGIDTPKNFEEFIYRHWGTGIAKHFMVPYNTKLWAVPLTEMAFDWLGPRVPQPRLEDMIVGALQPQPKPMGPNATFGYPLRGGFEALMRGFLPLLRQRDVTLACDSRVTAVSPRRHTITINGREEVAYERLVSSMPLPELIRAVGDAAPAAVRSAARKLRKVAVRCVNVGIGRGDVTDKHWIYYHQDTVFHRIFVQSNASPYCQPPGTSSLTAEITYSEYKPLPEDGLNERVLADFKKVGLLRDDDEILCLNQVDIPYAYVVQDHARPEAVATIRAWLETQDIYLCGRYAEWEYYNSDNAIASGRAVATRLNALEPRRERLVIPTDAISDGSVLAAGSD